YQPLSPHSHCLTFSLCREAGRLHRHPCGTFRHPPPYSLPLPQPPRRRLHTMALDPNPPSKRHLFLLLLLHLLHLTLSPGHHGRPISLRQRGRAQPCREADADAFFGGPSQLPLPRTLSQVPFHNPTSECPTDVRDQDKPGAVERGGGA